MKRLLALLSVNLLISTLALAQTRFQRTVGTTEDERNYHLTSTRDGGMVATGYTDAISGNRDDAFLVKYNKMGKVVWSKTYGDTGDDYSWDIMETSNGDLIGAGYTSSFGTPRNAATLTRTDSAGNVQWLAALYTTALGIDFYRSVETSTGHVLATGLMQSASNKDEIVLAKFTKNGYFLWLRTVGGSESDEAMGLIETSQGHYLLSGLTQDTRGNGKSDFAVSKLDTAGNLIWSYLYGGSGSDRLNSCVEFDNLYYFTGWSSSEGEGGDDVVLMETDTAGKVNWTKTYGTDRNERCFNMLYDPLDRNFIMAGYTEKFSSSSSSDNRNAFVLKTDISGNMKWAESYGGGKIDGHWPTGLALNGDMGYYVLSSSNTFGTGGYDLYLTKVDSAGSAGCNTRTPGFKEGSAKWSAKKFGTLGKPVVTAVKTTISGSSWKLTQKMQCCSLYVNPGLADTLCPGDTAFLGSPSIAAYSYEWFKGGSSVSKNSELSVPYGEGASYNLIVSSSGSGCGTVVKNVKIVNDKKPTMIPYDEVRFCEGDSVPINLVGDFVNADWTSTTSTSLSDTGRTYIPTVNDSLFIEVETTFGCAYFDTVKLTPLDYPSIVLDDTSGFCFGDSVYIPVQSNYAWFWENDTSIKDTGLWTQDTFWHRVSSYNEQCISRDSILIERLDFPVMDLGPDMTVCPGTEVCLKGQKDSEIDFLEWNGSFIADSFCTDLDTMVFVTVYGINGCFIKDSINIRHHKVADKVFAQDTVKGSGTVKLDVGTIWVSQLWETTDTTQTLDVNDEQWYTVVVTDGNGCTVVDSVYAAIGVGRSELSDVLSVYPNPFHNSLSIDLQNEEQVQVRLLDEMGREVFKQNMVQGNQVIHTSTLPIGVYLLESISNGKTTQRTVVIKQ